ncbi:hypothetical protein D3C78_1064900 [compost metagenome]
MNGSANHCFHCRLSQDEPSIVRAASKKTATGPGTKEIAYVETEMKLSQTRICVIPRKKAFNRISARIVPVFEALNNGWEPRNKSGRLKRTSGFDSITWLMSSSVLRRRVSFSFFTSCSKWIGVRSTSHSSAMAVAVPAAIAIPSSFVS